MADNLETSNIIVQDGQGNNQLAQAVASQSGSVVWSDGEKTGWCIVEDAQGNKQLALKVYDYNGGGGGGGEQNIKAYHAPSATLDATLAIVIPNVDAVQEEGLYNVDYTVENEGTTLNANCILSVGTVSTSGVVAQVDQTMIIGLNGSYVYLNRSYVGGQWSAWSGKNIPVELMKCLQNTATGTSSLTVAGNPSTYNSTINIGANSIISGHESVAIGYNSNSQGTSVAVGVNAQTNQSFTTAIGYHSECGNKGGSIKDAIGAYAYANGYCCIAIGGGTSKQTSANATANYAIQLGQGVNNVANQFQVYTYPMLDGGTGKIPNERLRITVADTSSTSATIANVEGGKDYTFSQALTALSITAITSSFVEANIYFTADTGIAVTLPANTPTIGDFTFTAGKSYVISIQNGIAVRGELN